MMKKRLQRFLDVYAELVYDGFSGRAYKIRSRSLRQQPYTAVALDGLVEGFGRTLNEAMELLA